MQKINWFTNARFGMFIHWGIYSIPALGDPWYRSQQRASIDEYQAYFNSFNPVLYNPAQWARTAKAAGMKYMVLTAKHHDGFCLFDSQHTDYKVTNTPAKRDLVKEFLDAGRAEGLGVGLYYSLLDWHHPDYPKYCDPFHPSRGRAEVEHENIQFSRYLDYMHAQVEELVSNYGKLDIMWFDFSYGDLTGEAWRASELVRMVRQHQEDIIIDNRLEASGGKEGSISTLNPSEFSGDFISPEHFIPYIIPKKEDGSMLPWELCTTINNNWGYAPNDHLYKPAGFLVRKMVECVSKNGNLMLNVGPSPFGEIADKETEILGEIGRWMDINCESVYGCGSAELPRPDWGCYTLSKDRKNLYAHLFEPPVGPIALWGVKPSCIKRVRLLCDGREIHNASDSFVARSNSDTTFLSLGSDVNGTYPLPNQYDTVIKIILN